MRRLILEMGVSIDGFVARLDGKHDWGYREDEAARACKLESLRGAGAHVMGRVTYNDMASVWPSSTSEIGAAMNEIPKVVFSRTLQTADWPESRIASGPLAEEVARLKREPGRDLLAHGGATFARALTREALVDEYRLMIHPAALGTGRPIFAELPRPLHLELIEARTFGSGGAWHVYRPRS
jgi:dihydrofolate reductase